MIHYYFTTLTYTYVHVPGEPSKVLLTPHSPKPTYFFPNFFYFAMPTFIDWKTLSLAFLLILQTVVTGESDFVNVETPFSVDPSLDESGLVGGNLIAEGINNFNEPLQQQVPDLRVQRDPNWLVANEKDLCASSSSNQIQTPGRRRLRLKREGYLCPSDLNGNAQPPQAVRNGDQTGSTPKKETNADPLKVPSAWLDLPKNPQLCGAATGLAQFSVCHSGFPRVESYALWLENIRPSK